MKKEEINYLINIKVGGSLIIIFGLFWSYYTMSYLMINYDVDQRLIYSSVVNGIITSFVILGLGLIIFRGEEK